MDQNKMTDWDLEEDSSGTTLEEMDKLVTVLKEARDKYDAASEAKTQAHNELEAVQKLVLDTLRTNKRMNYSVQGIGTVYVIEKEVYRTPKTNEDKIKLFNYIKEKYGPDALMSMTSIVHQTLNSWANKESESGVMSIPGLEAPTMTETVGLRKR